jgi:hypothetical protein
MDADKRGSGKIGNTIQLLASKREAGRINHRENSLMLHRHSNHFRDPSTPARSQARSRSVRMTNKSRNMSRYPMVLKDYGIVAYFARGFRYNGQALVYSGLLACNAGLASRNAAFTAAYGLKDRPQ